MGHLGDRKFWKVRFVHPVWVDGLGMVEQIDTSPDPETKAPRLVGVSITWLAQDRLLKVVTAAGETLLCPAGWCGKQKFDDLTKAKK